MYNNNGSDNDWNFAWDYVHNNYGDDYINTTIIHKDQIYKVINYL
jgi:hypothetical protein